MNSDYNRISATGDSDNEQTLERRISERVIRSVAATKGENPIEMRPPLYDVIDPEALDALFESESMSVEFTWQDCHIVINETGTIDVTEDE